MNTWMLSLQNSNSPIFDMMIFFHDSTMMILMTITSFILIIMFYLTKNIMINRFLLQNNIIELIWTFMPMMLLFFIAIPSIKILYLMDEFNEINLSIKTIGNQWYWNYEYSDFNEIKFDSFMITENYMLMNNFRLLEVDNRCIMPINFPIRIMSTSMDVIHAWTVPSLGIKMDSIPGRLNQTTMMINRPGMFFGQCSEICGINHSFMPIVIESTNLTNFKSWLNQF